jgi:hypothetical protein
MPAAAAVIAVLSISGFALAAPPSGTPNAGIPAVSIAIAPNPAVFGFTTAVSGRLTGIAANKNASVALQANPYPYTAGFATVATTKTGQTGRYSFTVRPLARLHYRTVATAATSTERVVWVRQSASLLLSDATLVRGQMVRFFGFVRPPHGTRLVLLQRRGADGVFRSVAGTYAHNVPMRTYSSYSRVLRVFADGTYRVVALSGDADHLAGISAPRFVNVS